MTETQQYICPLGDCEYSAGSRVSVENHINGSTKPPHEGESGAEHRDAIRAVSVDDPAADRGDRAESADGSGVEQARFPASDRGDDRAEPDAEPAGDRGGDRGKADCCDDPDRAAAEGRYRLEDGTVVAADAADEYCESCGALVEPDGTVMR